jgi:hypothetical protein
MRTRIEFRSDAFPVEPELNMKVLLIALVGLILSGATRAADLSAVAGHYRYEQYAVTLPNGRVLQLKDLGASEAFLDISQTEITLRMTLARGDTVTQPAKILEAHFDKGTGYWKAQWPDMKGPVRANVTLVGDVLTSDTRFDNQADPQYGSTEHAVLKRVSGK